MKDAAVVAVSRWALLQAVVDAVVEGVEDPFDRPPRLSTRFGVQEELVDQAEPALLDQDHPRWERRDERVGRPERACPVMGVSALAQVRWEFGADLVVVDHMRRSQAYSAPGGWAAMEASVGEVVAEN
ncbi:hypothetical protein GCM10017687_24740 [Streptomyces echinatus]